MPTFEERRQIENAEEDERFWSELREAHEEQSAENQELAAGAGREAYRAKQEAEKAAAQAQTARERIARLKAGEDIAGGTGSTRLSQKEMIAIIGGPAAARRALRVSEIHEAGASEELLEEMGKEHQRGRNAVINAVWRRRVVSRQ
jgi:hypothetical protein